MKSDFELWLSAQYAETGSFTAFIVLVRIADEVCLQMHLLNLSFVLAVRNRAGDDAALARSICTRQLTGIAGVAAERIRRALNLTGDLDGLAAGERA